MAHTVKLSEVAFNVTLPKGAGTMEVNVGNLPDEILTALVEHGTKQKLADIAVNLHVKADRKSPKDTDVLFDTEDELRKAIRERAAKLLSRWVEGEWTMDGGAVRGDPVMGEIWSIFFTALKVPTTERAALRKAGTEELSLRLWEAKSGKPRPKGEAAQGKIATSVLAQVRARAETIVASRAQDLAIDL